MPYMTHDTKHAKLDRDCHRAAGGRLAAKIVSQALLCTALSAALERRSNRRRRLYSA